MNEKLIASLQKLLEQVSASEIFYNEDLRNQSVRLRLALAYLRAVSKKKC